MIETSVRILRLALLAALTALVGSCDEGEPAAPPQRPKGPAHVTVEHILIGVAGAPRMDTTRSPQQAHQLAQRIVEMVKAEPGAWDGLKRRYSDDNGPGIYAMANHGEPLLLDETTRSGMVEGFGDVAFALEVGQIGIAEFDPTGRCPFGYHVIKRIK